MSVTLNSSSTSASVEAVNTLASDGVLHTINAVHAFVHEPLGIELICSDAEFRSGSCSRRFPVHSEEGSDGPWRYYLAVTYGEGESHKVFGW